MRQQSPALVVAVVALVAALAGSAIGGVATTAGLNGKERKQVRKVVKKVAFTKAQSDARFLRGSNLPTTHAQDDSIVNDFNVGNFTNVFTDSVSVPGSGTLLIWGNLSFEHDATGGAFGTPVETRITVGNTPAGTVQQATIEPTSGYSDSTAPVAAVEVVAGSHTIALQAVNTEAGWIAIEGRSIDTLFVPN